MVRDVNKLELSRADAGQAAALLARFDNVMGVLGEEKEESPDAEIESLIRRRDEARARRDFKTSDEIRDQLKAKGIILEDSAGGTRWKRA